MEEVFFRVPNELLESSFSFKPFDDSIHVPVRVTIMDSVRKEVHSTGIESSEEMIRISLSSYFRVQSYAALS